MQSKANHLIISRKEQPKTVKTTSSKTNSQSLGRLKHNFKRKEPQREDNSVDSKSTHFKFARKKFDKNNSSEVSDNDNYNSKTET